MLSACATLVDSVSTVVARLSNCDTLAATPPKLLTSSEIWVLSAKLSSSALLDLCSLLWYMGLACVGEPCDRPIHCIDPCLSLSLAVDRDLYLISTCSL